MPAGLRTRTIAAGCKLRSASRTRKTAPTAPSRSNGSSNSRGSSRSGEHFTPIGRSECLDRDPRDNISLEAFDRLQRHYAKEGLDTYSDLIIGLPAETYATFTEGVSRVIRNGQLNRVAFYECSVLPNAPMARLEYREAFEIETVPVKLVHAHEPLDRGDGDEPEFLEMVISTSTMKREDWIRARVFAYFVDLLF